MYVDVSRGIFSIVVSVDNVGMVMLRGLEVWRLRNFGGGAVADEHGGCGYDVGVIVASDQIGISYLRY